MTPWILEEGSATLRVCASEGLGYIGLRRLQVRLLPVARAAVAQRIEQRTNTWAADSRRKSLWCAEGERLLRSSAAVMNWGGRECNSRLPS